jgi:hypothetical protein
MDSKLIGDGREGDSFEFLNGDFPFDFFLKFVFKFSENIGSSGNDVVEIEGGDHENSLLDLIDFVMFEEQEATHIEFVLGVLLNYFYVRL